MSVFFALHGSGLDRCDDILLWLGAGRKMDHKIDSLWALGPDSPCSSCCISYRDPWNFLHNTLPCTGADTPLPTGISLVGRRGTACYAFLYMSYMSYGREYIDCCPYSSPQDIPSHR